MKILLSIPHGGSAGNVLRSGVMSRVLDANRHAELVIASPLAAAPAEMVEMTEMAVTEINPMVAHAVGRLLGIVQVTQGHLVDHPLVVDPVVRVVPVDPVALAAPVDPVVLVVAEVVVGAEAEAFLLVVLHQRPEGKWNTSLTLSALALVKHSRP